MELRADVLVPGFASRKLGQVPCEDVAIRFPIPEAWIYLFRVEKHHRYGSVKSAHRYLTSPGAERFPVSIPFFTGNELPLRGRLYISEKIVVQCGIPG